MHARPLPTHPQFSITHWPGFTEYRVEHWRLVRDGSGRFLHREVGWSRDVVVLVGAVLVVWAKAEERHVPLPVRIVAVITLVYLLWTRFTQVLHESLLVFPALGIQLETHRGHPLFPLYTTRCFIPLSALEDVVIHEGLRGWHVRYYLAELVRKRPRVWPSDAGSGAATQHRDGGIEVQVAFEHILPYFPVLKEIYLGVQRTLFPQPVCIIEDDERQ